MNMSFRLTDMRVRTDMTHGLRKSDKATNEHVLQVDGHESEDGQDSQVEGEKGED